MKRHERLEFLATQMERHMWKLATKDSGDERYYALPLFTYRHSRINMGRKDKSRTSGTKLLVPIRILWDIPVTGPLETLPEEATYTLASAGWSDSETHPLKDAGEFSPTILTAREIHTLGAESYFTLLGWIEERCHYYLPRATASLEISLFGESGENRKILSEVEAEELITSFVYGSDSQSRAMSIIRAATRENATRKADLQKIMVTQIKRDLKEDVRRKIGDPRMGARIRAISRELGLSTLDDDAIAQIQEAYSKTSPTKIGHARITEALTLSRTLPTIVSLSENS